MTSRRVSFGAFLLGVVAAASLVTCRAKETPVATVPPGGTPSWADYVRDHPYRRDLDPAVAHPGWRGARTACGAGKCE